VTTFCSSTGLLVSTALRPEMSCTSTTPKLYTSDFMVAWPLRSYSGAQQPKEPIMGDATCVLPPACPSCASPKSVSLGVKSASRRMWDALNSPYTTGGLAVSCRYSSPCAAPWATFILVHQSIGFLSSGKSTAAKRPHRQCKHYCDS
jgi:hypothetical protein